MEIPGGCCLPAQPEAEHDPVAALAGLDPHVLPGVVAADDRRGGAPGGGDGHGVVDAVAYQGPVSRGALGHSRVSFYHHFKQYLGLDLIDPRSNFSFYHL